MVAVVMAPMALGWSIDWAVASLAVSLLLALVFTHRPTLTRLSGSVVALGFAIYFFCPQCSEWVIWGWW